MKRSFHILLFFLFLGSVLLPLPVHADEPVRETIMYDDVEREYFVYLPPGFEKTASHPLLLALHGGGGTAKKMDQSTHQTLSKAAAKHGVVMVMPQGVDKGWNDGRVETFQGWKKKTPQDDLGFLSLLIDTIHKEYGTDPKRVYATGISNGGFMSIRLAMDLSNKVTAVAPVAAQISEALKDHRPLLPVSIMIINGTADPLVPYNGGVVRVFKRGKSRGRILSTERSIDIFREHNRCKPEVFIEDLPDNDPNDGATARKYSYKDGTDNTEVALICIEGGGHTWPGGMQYLSKRIVGTVCRDFDASEMILEFLLRHSR